MKFTLFVLLFVALYVRYTVSINEAQMKAAVKLIKNTCRTKTKITDEQIEKMHKGIWEDDDEVTKCYTYCCLGMMKLRGKDGAFIREMANPQLQQLPEDMRNTLAASFDNCVNAGEGLTNKCDLSYAFFKCMYFDNPEKYIFP